MKTNNEKLEDGSYRYDKALQKNKNALRYFFTKVPERI